jgi:hypothetical protein
MALSVAPSAALSAPQKTAPQEAPPAATQDKPPPAATPKVSVQARAAASATGAPGKAAADAKSEADPPPAQVKRARDLWYRGVEAFRKGDYEEARLAFTECYALMPKSDVLRNLSISEIQSGHYVSAARHLRQLLAAGELPTNVREEATTRLAQAEAQIGQLAVTVDVAGADISVDGTNVGRSPLDDSWYLEPGLHEVIVSKPGYPVDQRQIFALAGVSIPVEVSLESLKRERAADEEAARLMGTLEGQDPVPYEGDEISTGSTLVLIATGTLAAAGLGAGIYFTVAANEHDEEADELLANQLPNDTAACGSMTMFGDLCAPLRDARQDALDDRHRALVGFVGFGVASAVTLGYALWLALDGTDGESTAAAKGLEPSFSIAPGSASFSLQGQF